MLAYILALAVGLGSFALYMAAFFFPEVHRKNDLIWSGVGLFYALVLWVCAERITGGVLLGQTASVALLGWLGWQTMTLRRQTTPQEQQTAAPSAAEVKATLGELSSPAGRAKLSGQVSRQLTGLKGIWQRRSPEQSTDTSAPEPYVPLTRADFDLAQRERQTEEQLAEAASTIAAELTSEDITPPESAEPPTLAATIKEAVAEIDSQPQVAQETIDPVAAEITEAAAVVAEAIATAPEPPIATPIKSGGIFAPITNLFKGFGKQKDTKPVYVRKQFRQEDSEAEPKPKKATKEAKPVYVRKQFRKPESEAEPEAEAATNKTGDTASPPADAVAEIVAEVVETTTTWQDSAGEMTAELIEDTVTFTDQTGEILAEVVEDSITVKDQAGEVVAEVMEETITLKDEAFATFANLAETPIASETSTSNSATAIHDSESPHESSEATIEPETAIDTAEEIIEEMLEEIAAESPVIIDPISAPEAGGESEIELFIETTVPEITPPTELLADVSASDAPEPIEATSADPETAQLPENPAIAEDNQSDSASTSVTSDSDSEPSPSDAPTE